MGRFLDTALVQELAAITRLDLTLARLDDRSYRRTNAPRRFCQEWVGQGLSERSRRAYACQAEQIQVEVLSDESIAGYTLLSDISGTPDHAGGRAQTASRTRPAQSASRSDLDRRRQPGLRCTSFASPGDQFCNDSSG
jgi:hypothetical protein